MSAFTFGHTPDADDAYMFWALTTNRINTSLNIKHEIMPIQQLNTRLIDNDLDISAVSVTNLPNIADNYNLLSVGGCFGEKYGPKLISRNTIPTTQLQNKKIGVPGRLTTACTLFHIYLHELAGVIPENIVVLPFNEILPSVARGDIDAGIIIDEGQLTYKSLGLNLIVDLGEWWNEQYGLPIPLGADVVRKSLPDEVKYEVHNIFTQSVQQALDNREQALDYALKYGRGISKDKGREFVGMYVNKRTLDMGDDGFNAIKLLIEKGSTLGLFENKLPEILTSISVM